MTFADLSLVPAVDLLHPDQWWLVLLASLISSSCPSQSSFSWTANGTSRSPSAARLHLWTTPPQLWPWLASICRTKKMRINSLNVWKSRLILAQDTACYILVLIVENVNFEIAACDECRVSVRGKGFLWWEPEVKLSQPILECVHLDEGKKERI